MDDSRHIRGYHWISLVCLTTIDVRGTDMLRNAWIGPFCTLALLVWAPAWAAKPKPRPQPARIAPPLPFPTTDIHRSGYNSVPPDEICCRDRLIGWTASGNVATLASSYSPDGERFRYAIELHDPAFLEPEELFAIEFFLADDLRPEGCKSASDPLRCIWNLHRREIQATLKMHGVSQSEIRMKNPPAFEVQIVTEPLWDPLGESVGLTVLDSAGKLVVQMADTSLPGLHLWPIGSIVRNRPTPVRDLVMRAFRKSSQGTATQDMGIRLLRLDDR